MDMNYVLYLRRGDNMTAKKREDGDKARYDMKYYHKNVKRVVLNFNLQKHKEKVMVAWIDLQGNVSSYIKGLVEMDMQKAELSTSDTPKLRQAEILAETNSKYQPKP